MRELGYAAVDAVVEHLGALRSGPTFTPPPPDLAKRVAGSPPEEGGDPVELMGWLQRELLGPGVRNHHPGMFAYIPVVAVLLEKLADMLAEGLNIFGRS